MTQSLLELSGVAARYGPIRALSEVTLAVRPGEVVALLGANGAGKSTLLKAIMGLVAAEGRMEFAGRPLAGLAPESRARAGIGYCPEGRRVFPGMSVRENLEVACRRGPASMAALVDGVFALFPALAQRQASPGWQLSGGQQQMLAIGRALMGEPTLLLLDEPSLGLSPLLTDQVLARVRDIVTRGAARGAAVLIAEQNVAKALAIADRAYVLQVGRIALEGPARTLAASEAVRRAFLGGD